MSNETRPIVWHGRDTRRGGRIPLTMESTYLIGRALGHDLMRGTAKAQAVMGQDTRESSAWNCRPRGGGYGGGGSGGTQCGRDYDAGSGVPGAVAWICGGSGDLGFA